MADEERNRRAAQDFSRMSLAGSSGAQPAAPQHYPPAYQVGVDSSSGLRRAAAACVQLPCCVARKGIGMGLGRVQECRWSNTILPRDMGSSQGRPVWGSS